MSIRQVVRGLVRQSGFSSVALVTIAIGIGVATTMFSVVEAVLLRSLPFSEPDRLVMLWNTKADGARSNLSGADLIDFQEANQSFDGLAAFSPKLTTAQTESGLARLSGVEVTPNFFRVLKVPMIEGEDFSRSPSGRFVILSYDYWQSHQGGRASIVGESLRLNGVQYTVRGIAPASFALPWENADLWLRAFDKVPAPPMDFGGKSPEQLRGLHWLRAIGRLRDGVELDSARADLEVIAARLASEYPDDNAGRSTRLSWLRDEVQQQTRSPLLILFGAVGLMLVIALVNVAGLLVARSEVRRKDIAIRRALGAGKSLLTELLAESVLLSTLGGVCGLALAHVLNRVVLSLTPLDIFGLDAAGLNWTVLLVSLSVSVLTGVGFAVVPAVDMIRLDVVSALSATQRGTTRRKSIRSMLVISQMGVAVVLLIGAGLLARSYEKLSSVDPGFDTKQIITLNTWLPETQFDEDEISGVYSRMLEAFNAISGVESATAVMGVPLSGMSADLGFLIEGQPPPAPGEEPSAGFQSVAPDYFRTLSIPMLRGRDFNDNDGDDSPAVAIVNITMAERHFPGQDPLAQRVSFDGEEFHEIVGVVGDVHHDGLDELPRAEVYVPYLQAPIPFMSFVIKTDRPEHVVRQAQQVTASIDPDIPLYKIRSLEEVRSLSIAHPRYQSQLLGGFAILSLALACIGLYGLISYVVTQRFREFGIRVAVGARPWRLARLVLGESLRLAGIGAALGIVVSLLAGGLLQSLLFDVAPFDLVTLVVAPVVLLVAVIGASLVPTYRAIRTNPIVALRAE